MWSVQKLLPGYFKGSFHIFCFQSEPLQQNMIYKNGNDAHMTIGKILYYFWELFCCKERINVSKPLQQDSEFYPLI